MSLDEELKTLAELIEYKSRTTEKTRTNENIDDDIAECGLRVWLASVQNIVHSGKIAAVYQHNGYLLKQLKIQKEKFLTWTNSNDSPVIFVHDYTMKLVQSLFKNIRVEYGYAEFDIKQGLYNDDWGDIKKTKWEYHSKPCTFKISQGPHVASAHVNSTLMHFLSKKHLPTKTNAPHYLDVEDKIESNGQVYSYSKSLVPVFFFWDPAQILKTCAKLNEQLPTPLLRLIINDYLPIDFTDYYAWCF